VTAPAVRFLAPALAPARPAGGVATFPAPGLRNVLVHWQRELVRDLLRAGAIGIDAEGDAIRRNPCAGFVRFLRKRGMVILTEDRRILASDRRGLADLLAAGDG
jgi:hypothetical protein